MDLNGSESPHHSSKGCWSIISDNAVPYSHRGAHRSIPCGDLVAMVIRFAGLEVQERSSQIDERGSMSHHTADDSWRLSQVKCVRRQILMPPSSPP